MEDFIFNELNLSMEKNIMLICNDHLENFSALLKVIKEQAPYTVEITSISHLLSGKLSKKLRSKRVCVVGCTATKVLVIDLKIVLKEKQKINKINTLRHLF